MNPQPWKIQIWKYQLAIHNRRKLMRNRLRAKPHIYLFGLEGLLATAVTTLGSSFVSMFATRLGADAAAIGLLSSLPQLVAMMLLLPLSAWAAGRPVSRWPVILFALLEGIFYGLIALAPLFPAASGLSIPFLILMSALATAFLNVYTSAWQSFYSETTPLEDRNASYSLRTLAIYVTTVLVVLLNGLILGNIRSDATRIRLYQISFALAAFFALLQWRVLRRLPAPRRVVRQVNLSYWRNSLRRLLHSAAVRRFGLTVFLFHAGWYMGWPLFFLTEVNYAGANETWIALITMSQNLLLAFLVRPWARYMARHGSARTFFVGTMGMATNPLFTITALLMPDPLKLPVLLLVNALSASFQAPFQLALLEEMLQRLPEEDRSLNLAFFNTGILAMNGLMQYLGVAVYRLLGTSFPAMLLALALTSLLRVSGALSYLISCARKRK